MTWQWAVLCLAAVGAPCAHTEQLAIQAWVPAAVARSACPWPQFLVADLPAPLLLRSLQLLEKARGLSLRTFGLANTVVGMLRA